MAMMTELELTTVGLEELPKQVTLLAPPSSSTMKSTATGVSTAVTWLPIAEMVGGAPIKPSPSIVPRKPTSAAQAPILKVAILIALAPRARFRVDVGNALELPSVSADSTRY